MVRNVFDDEYGIIAEIEKASFTNPWGADVYAQFAENPFIQILVSTDEQMKITGYVIYQSIFGEVEILRLAVLPEFRKQGYGDKLLKKALEEAYESAILEVRVSNTPAIKLYESNGFKLIDTRKKYYENGEDAYVYVR